MTMTRRGRRNCLLLRPQIGGRRHASTHRQSQRYCRQPTMTTTTTTTTTCSRRCSSPRPQPGGRHLEQDSARRPQSHPRSIRRRSCWLVRRGEPGPLRKRKARARRPNNCCSGLAKFHISATIACGETKFIARMGFHRGDSSRAPRSPRLHASTPPFHAAAPGSVALATDGRRSDPEAGQLRRVQVV